MRKLQKLSIFMLAAALVLSMSIAVHAHDIVQMDKKGTVSVTMHMGDKTVGGGTLTIYRVGEVRENDGNYTFAPTGDFVGCKESFKDVTSSVLAGNLEKYAVSQKLSGETKTIGTDGKATFADLEVGLYLFVQNEAASGYNKAKSFLVTVPYMQDDGKYGYEVDAWSKAELTKAPTPTPVPSTPDDPKLPQTGQLNWPIPVLTAAGLLLFTVGWILCFSKKKQNEK